MTQPALLLIHGFGGGTFELAPLKRLLRDAGYVCSDFTLPGHDPEGRVDSSTRAEDYLHAARRAYLRLVAQHRRVAIIGFSMGGLLALNLASEFRPTSVAIINVPILPWNLAAIFHWLCDDWRRRCLLHTKRFICSATRQNPLTYLQYFLLLLRTLPLLKNITCPCLIAQSDYDDTAHYLSAGIFAQLLTHVLQERHHYTASGHTICHSPDLCPLFRDLHRFLVMK